MQIGSAADCARVMPPPPAVFETDVSHAARAGSPSKRIGQRRTETPRVPVSWLNRVDAIQLVLNGRHALREAITVDGELQRPWRAGASSANSLT